MSEKSISFFIKFLYSKFKFSFLKLIEFVKTSMVFWGLAPKPNSSIFNAISLSVNLPPGSSAFANKYASCIDTDLILANFTASFAKALPNFSSR